MHGSGGRRPLSGRRCSKGVSAEPLRGRAQEDRAASGWRSSDCGDFWVPGKSALPTAVSAEGRELPAWELAPSAGHPGEGPATEGRGCRGQAGGEVVRARALHLVQSGGKPGPF